MDITVAQAGPWGLFASLVVLVVVALVRGDLVPRKTHEDIVHDRDMWRAAHMTSESARQEDRDQRKELLEHARTTTSIIAALPSPKD